MVGFKCVSYTKMKRGTRGLKWWWWFVRVAGGVAVVVGQSGKGDGGVGVG